MEFFLIPFVRPLSDDDRPIKAKATRVTGVLWLFLVLPVQVSWCRQVYQLLDINSKKNIGIQYFCVAADNCETGHLNGSCSSAGTRSEKDGPGLKVAAPLRTATTLFPADLQPPQRWSLECSRIIHISVYLIDLFFWKGKKEVFHGPHVGPLIDPRDEGGGGTCLFAYFCGIIVDTCFAGFGQPSCAVAYRPTGGGWPKRKLTICLSADFFLWNTMRRPLFNFFQWTRIWWTNW